MTFLLASSIGLTAPLFAQAANGSGTHPSAVTITARDYDPDYENAPFPNLSVTVSQTADLVAQAVTVSFSGGLQSTVWAQQYQGRDFLQIFQCWDDLRDEQGQPVLTANGHRQPDRETCQFGAANAAGHSRVLGGSSHTPDGEPYTAEQDEQYTALRGAQSETAIPFRSVTGDVLARIENGEVVSGIDLDDNEFFSRYTTNELAWAGFGAAGTGSVPFELQTTVQAPGLGCGAQVTDSNGTVTGRPCWLVVLPRDTTTNFQGQEVSVNDSGLLWQHWKHHLAVPLDFKPVGLRCAIGSAERAVRGSQLVAQAIGSWQPVLCAAQGGAAFTHIVAPEEDAVLDANEGTARSPLAFTVRAIADDWVEDRLAYAPVAVTGVAVAFAIDRSAGIGSPTGAEARDRESFAEIRLTPRLVAKLLTNSYTLSLTTGANLSHLGSNPQTIAADPEFLELNDPEFAYQSFATGTFGIGISDALVPIGRTDAAWVLWEYVLADAGARAFLNGEPDPWGTVVNPYYSTNAALNPTGYAQELPSTSFPKSDPSEAAIGGGYPLGVVGWRPYTHDLADSARQVLRGNRQGINGTWAVTQYVAEEPRPPGFRRVFGVTHTAASDRYLVATASLRNPAGEFVAPTEASLTAAIAAFTANPDQPQVAGFDSTSAEAAAATAAYPLAVPVYAAANPEAEDAAARADYAALIRYAATDGQVQGTDDGQLPVGYAPLSAAQVAQALAAADAIEQGGWPEDESPDPTPSPSTSVEPTPTPSGGPTPTLTTPGGPAPGPGAGGTPPVGGEESPDGADQATGDPDAVGASGIPLTGAATPEDPELNALGAVLPVSAALGVLAALAAPAVSRSRSQPQTL